MNTNDYIRWNLCNQILNILRKFKGEKLRPKIDNPFNRQEENSGV